MGQSDEVVAVNAVNLDLCRRAAGMSQRRLSELSGVSTGYISRILNGEQERVSVEVIERLLHAFGNRVTLAELRRP